MLALTAVLLLLLAPGLTRLRMRTDGHALVPTHAPQIQTDRKIRDTFGIEDPIVVLIRTTHPQGVFNAATVGYVLRLTERLGKIDGVRPQDLFSLATEHGDRVWPGTLNVRRLLEPPPETEEDLQRLRSDLQAYRLYSGTLVSRDERATAVMVGVPAGADRTAMYRQVGDAIAECDPGADAVHVIGSPVAEALLGTHILEDLGVPRRLLPAETWGGFSVEPDQRTWSAYRVRLQLARAVGLVPLALLVMMLVFWIAFRSLVAAATPLVEAGVCLLAVFSLMGYCGVPVYLTIAVMPVILTAIGVADEIHIFRRYVENLETGTSTDVRAVVEQTMSEMLAPVVKTSVTTSIGFLSFCLSDIAAVRAFGVFTAVGVLLCLAFSLTVVPALLVLTPVRWILPRARRTDANGLGGTLRDLGLLAARHRWGILVVVGVGSAGAWWGVSRVTVQDSWIDGFAPESEFYRATTEFNQQFLGTHLLQICAHADFERHAGRVTAADLSHHDVLLPAAELPAAEQLVGRRLKVWRADASAAAAPGSNRPLVHGWEGWIESAVREGEKMRIAVDRRKGSPRIALEVRGGEAVEFEIRKLPFLTREPLQRLESLGRNLETRTEWAVGGVLGAADYLKTAHFMSRGRHEEHRVIPETSERIDWVWTQYRRIRGPERLAQLVDPDFSQSLTTVFLKNANFADTARLIDDIRALERQELTPLGMRLELGGDVAVSQSLIQAIVTTQLESLGLSLLGIWLVTSLMSRSAMVGTLAVLPCALAVWADFALMGWAGIPLGVATSMFAGMTLGIGVDYAIHLLEQHRRARDKGLTGSAAVGDAVLRCGPAVLIDAVAVALGFGMLVLSQVPANARLGLLVVSSIAGCLLATFLLLPALLAFDRKVSVPQV